jgi:hypothetical protein
MLHMHSYPSSYHALFDLIPANMIWELILEPHLSIKDMATLDHAAASKLLREHFFRGLGCESPPPGRLLRSGRSTNHASNLPLMFYGKKWDRYREVWNNWRQMKWCVSRGMQIYGASFPGEALS